MYALFLRAIAFGTFCAWLVSANRAHRHEPDDCDDDGGGYDDALHTEGFA